MTKLGKQIATGDKLFLDNGKTVTVRSISKGMLPRCLHVKLSNGDWSEIGFDDLVTIAEGPPTKVNRQE